MNEITQKYLKSVLYYDPETGIFTWIKSSSNRIQNGDMAGSFSKRGYTVIRISKKIYTAHRLAFLFMTGKFPIDEVDHINRIKTDNKWVNLRECNRTQNSANHGKFKNNKSGYKGVYWHKTNKKWSSEIYTNGNKIHLGFYTDIKEAAKTYNEAANKYHGEFAYINKIIE